MLNAHRVVKYSLAYSSDNVKKGCAAMKRRADGRWRRSITINGKQIYFYSTAASERQAERDILLQIAEYKEKEKHGKLFTEIADEWWKEHTARLAPNSLKNYSPAFKRAKEHFKNTFAKEIIPAQISRHIKTFAKGHADKTVRTQLNIYNLIFRYAVEMGYVPFNPARDLSVPPDLPKEIIPPPSDEDIKLTKISTDCTFGMFAYWAMYTGMRRGELLALDWSDVDIENRTISITKSVYHVSNRPYIKKPKTETSIGKVPILDTLLSKIKPSTGLVFPNEHGELITETQFQRLWELYQKESGVKATPHQYRHAYATMLFEAGIPPEEAQALLRHAQLSTTMDVYTALREQKQKNIFKKVYSVDIQ